jgi:hypothetical protein
MREKTGQTLIITIEGDHCDINEDRPRKIKVKIIFGITHVIKNTTLVYEVTRVANFMSGIPSTDTKR